MFGGAATGAPALVAGEPVGVCADGARSCDGVVAAVTPDIVEVAVPPACAPGVSAQVAVGGVVLARGQPTD